MKTSADGIRIIQHSEDCHLEAYKCPAGVWTIGWGHTGPDVKPGLVITQSRADELLAQDLASFERDVASLVKIFITQHQFDALVSFAYNCGSDIDSDTIAEGLGDSTLLRKVNSGEFKAAADEFLKWDKAGGKKLRGLTRRRHTERARFLGASGSDAIQIGQASA
jgi:lysozyme